MLIAPRVRRAPDISRVHYITREGSLRALNVIRNAVATRFGLLRVLSMRERERRDTL